MWYTRVNKLYLKARSFMSNHVYYVCYGSNLYKDRFQEYLDNSLYSSKTDTIDLWEELITANTTQKMESYRVNLPHEVYYSGHSARWGGGIAYLNVDKFSCKKIYRAYKLTRDQFASVFSQENGYYPSEDLNWNRILNSYDYLTQAGFYDRIVNLGTINGISALTFTSSDNRCVSEPGEKYSEIISKGRVETKKLPFIEILGK